MHIIETNDIIESISALFPELNQVYHPFYTAFYHSRKPVLHIEHRKNHRTVFHYQDVDKVAELLNYDFQIVELHKTRKVVYSGTCILPILELIIVYLNNFSVKWQKS